MSSDNYNANIRIRNLPRDVDHALTVIAAQRNCNKWEVVRDALIEYVELHVSTTSGDLSQSDACRTIDKWPSQDATR